MKYIANVNNKEYTLEVDRNDQIVVNDRAYQLDFQLLEGGIISLLLDNHSIEAIVEEREKDWEVLIHGELYNVQVQDERAYRLSQARGTAGMESGEVITKSPMPGVILNILVTVGQMVKKGDKVIILESMKMENELRAARDGVVKRIMVNRGASVEKNQELVIIGDGEGE